MKRFLSLLITLALLLSFSCVSFADHAVSGLELNVNGSAYGLDELDELIKNIGLTVRSGFDDNDAFLLDGVLKLTEEQSFRLVLTADENEIGFQFPELDEKYYCFDLKELASVLTKYASKNGVPTPVTVPDRANTLFSPLEALKLGKFFEKYGKIISALVTDDNISHEKSEYYLEAIGAGVECDVMRFTPTKSDWSSMIENLINSLLTDRQLRDFLNMALSTAPQTSSSRSVEETLSDFYSMLDELLEETDSIAEFLSPYSLTVAYDVSQPYAIRIDGEDLNIGYESYGDISDIRYDVLAMYGEEPAFLAINQLSADGENLEDLFYLPSLDASLSFLYNMNSSEVSATIDAPAFKADFSYTLPEDGNEFSATVDAGDFHGELLVTYEHRDGKDLLSAVVNAGDFVGNLDFSLSIDTLSLSVNAGDFSGSLDVTIDEDTLSAIAKAGDFVGTLDITIDQDTICAVVKAGNFAADLTLSHEYIDGADKITAHINAGDFSGDLIVTYGNKDGKELITIAVDTEAGGGELDITAEEKELAISVPHAEKVYLHDLSELEDVLGEMFY